MSEEGQGPLRDYLAERAKSGRSLCKKCKTTIDSKLLRVGIRSDAGRWGPMVSWYHIGCVVFDKSIVHLESIENSELLDEEAKDELSQRIADSAREIDTDAIPINPDELVRQEWTVTREEPPELMVPLLPYQKEGLGWMFHQEESEIRGGILADEMGLGRHLVLLC
jgi:DNA repair protein RAD16